LSRDGSEEEDSDS